MTDHDPLRRAVRASTAALLAAAVAFAAWAVHRNARPLAPTRPPVTLPSPNGYHDLAEAGRMAAAGGPKRAAAVASMVRAGLAKAVQCPPRTTAAAIASAPGWPIGALADTMAAEAGRLAARGRPDDALACALDGLEAITRCAVGAGVRECMECNTRQLPLVAAVERALPGASPAGLRIALARLQRIEAASPAPGATLQAEKAIVPVMQERLSRRALGPMWWLGRCIPSLDPTDDIARQFGMIDAFAVECSAPYSGYTTADYRVWRTSYTSARSLVRYRTARCVAAAALGMARVEAALEACRRLHGRWPDTLSALSPDLLPAPPADPFGGRAAAPFRYHAGQGGRAYRMYSLGPNLRDDGGTPSRHPTEREGDLVAGSLIAHGGRP